MILHLIRGLPGSVKSTFAHSLGCVHLEYDMLKIKDGVYNHKANPNLCKIAVLETTEYFLSKGVDVAVSNVFHTKKSIENFLTLAKKHGATVRIVHMTKYYGSIHNVPPVAIGGFKKNWEKIEGEVALPIDNQ